MATYQQSIREALAASGHLGQYEPRQIEAFMRLEHSTLDGLSAAQFRREVEIGRQCVDAAGPAGAESVADSFGLRG